MDDSVDNGTKREIDGKPRIFYEGYWVRCYPPPPENLREKRNLIERLTRRAFHHTEEGINTPGRRLEQARAVYAAQQDPARKRVNAAMLAGALFNRATDIFTSIVDLEEKGVKIGHENGLMKQCGDCLQEAMELGRQVRHYSGEEGIDELWGEPMKAFLMSISDFYDSRYIKIAWAMRDIDRIGDTLAGLADAFGFRDCKRALDEYIETSKEVCDTAKDDPEHLEIWPRYVASRDTVWGYCRRSSSDTDLCQRMLFEDTYRAMREGIDLASFVAGSRVPMPKSLQNFLDKCEALHLRQRVAHRASA